VVADTRAHRRPERLNTLLLALRIGRYSADMATTATRAAWQGYIALGRLGVPVRLYAATRAMRPRFVQLHESDGSPVERELKCAIEGRKIDPSEVVRAIEYEPGRYITLTDRELVTSTALPEKTIAIQQFCEPEAVPSIYFDKPFYVVPARGGERAYALLREVLARQHKLAVAQFVIYTQEHVAALSVYSDMLLLQQLHFAAEIVPRSTLKTPALPKPGPAELDVLGAVAERFSGPLYLGDYHDEHSERVHELVERKAQGLPNRRTERIAPHATRETEIVAALQDTLGETRLIGASANADSSGQ
jgi:DNA end-binding protein Ku